MPEDPTNPPNPPTPPVPPTTPTPPSGGGTPTETPGAVVTIEDKRVGSGGDKQETPPSDPNDPNNPPSANRGTENGGSRTITVTVQLAPAKL